MRTAKEIVREYRERGYDEAKLRTLAICRDEPMRSEMLAAIDALAAEDASADGMDAEVAEDNVVMFTVADSDGDGGGDGSVDFAACAADSPDSVAVVEVNVEDPLGAVEPAEKTDADGSGQMAGQSIWSRLWSSEVKAAANTFTSIFSNRKTPALAAEPVAAGETVDKVEPSASSEEAVDIMAATSSEMNIVPEAVAETVAETAPETAVADCVDAVPGTAVEAAAEAGTAEQPAGSVEEKQSAPTNLEESIDYIPIPDAGNSAAESAAVPAPIEAIAVAGESAASGVSEPVISESAAPIADEAVAEASAPHEVADVSEPVYAEKSDESEIHSEFPDVSEQAEVSEDNGAFDVSGQAEIEEGSANELVQVVASPNIVNHMPLSLLLASSRADELMDADQKANRRERRRRTRSDKKAKGKGKKDAEAGVHSLQLPALTEIVLDVATERGAAIDAAAAPAEIVAFESVSSQSEDAGDGEHAASEVAIGGIDTAPGGLAEETGMVVLDFVSDDEGDGSDASVIMFRPPAAVDMEDDASEFDFADDASDAEGMAPLRLLPPVETAAIEPVVEAAAESEPARLDPDMRAELVRAVVGAVECDIADESVSAGEHIVSVPEPEPEEMVAAARLAERDAEWRARLATASADAAAAASSASAALEAEWKTRLDAVAAELDSMRALGDGLRDKVAEGEKELAAKETGLRELSFRLCQAETEAKNLGHDLDFLKDEHAGTLAKLKDFRGLAIEHAELLREFEDLRKVYNELATDVMPGLQSERDELMLAFEKQSSVEDGLRKALRASGRRVAAGYALSAAAAVMLVALPVMHWLKADPTARLSAENSQVSSEVQARLETAERRNVEAEKRLFELEQEKKMALGELAKLEKANKALAQAANQHNREVALLQENVTRVGRAPAASNASGAPPAPIAAANRTTRTARNDNNALVGPAQANRTPTRRNEVRDTTGSIGQLVAENRQRYADDDSVLAAVQRANQDAGSRQRIPVSSVAMINGDAPPPAPRSAPAAAPTASALTGGGKTATVKAGEGVAQVVFRELGTRDPEVIAWVIKENGIKKDRRGNPMIYPEQKLKLPAGNVGTQSADAGRRGR